MTTRTTLYLFFQTGDKPTEAQFKALIDSTFNLNDDDYTQIVGLTDALVEKIGESQRNVTDGFAGLDAEGKLDPGVIPALKSHEFVVVANQAARLALTVGQVQLGDECYQSDNNKTYKLISENPALEGSWTEIADTTPDWSTIHGKPSTFTPASHTHAQANITNLVEDLATMQADIDTRAVASAVQKNPLPMSITADDAEDLTKNVFLIDATAGNILFEVQNNVTPRRITIIRTDSVVLNTVTIAPIAGSPDDIEGLSSFTLPAQFDKAELLFTGTGTTIFRLI